MPKNSVDRLSGLNQDVALILEADGLIPGQQAAKASLPQLVQIAPGQIITGSSLQTRAPFDPKHDPQDAELVQSVNEHGVIQPVVVYRIEGPQEEEPTYGMVSGHRRLEAAILANIETIPALVVPPETKAQDRDLLTALENLQRKDLRPLEKAAQIQRLMDRYGYNQREVASFIGLSESHLSSILRLLESPPEIRAAVQNGRLPIRYVREVERLSASEQEKVFHLTNEGMEYQAALENIATRAPNQVSSPSSHRQASTPGSAAAPSYPAKPFFGGSRRDQPERLGQLAGADLEEFRKSFLEHSLPGVVPDSEIPLLAIIWVARNRDMTRALGFYQGLTRGIRGELEKALQAFYRLGLLHASPREESQLEAIADLLEEAIQILLVAHVSDR